MHIMTRVIPVVITSIGADVTMPQSLYARDTF